MTDTDGLASRDADSSAARFLQRPFVQDVLPLVTSLTVHAAVLVAAVALVVGGGRVVREMTPLETQIVATDTAIVDVGPAGGVRHLGPGDDALRPPGQDEHVEGGDGWALKPGDAHAAPSLLGGGDGEDAGNNPVIGFSPAGGGIGAGDGVGGGTGTARDPGMGDGRGPLAPFGMRGGSFMGVPDRTPGVGGNPVTSVVFVCDASGSMINSFSSLKEQLVRSIDGLKSVQSFNVVFFQDEKCVALDAGLVFATPENKRKAFKWLEEQTTTGTTNPIPGIELAFRSRPQLVYLLTDADFPDNEAVRGAIRRLNAAKQTRINTIIFAGGDGEDEGSAQFRELMRQIAKDNGGAFARVRESELR